MCWRPMKSIEINLEYIWIHLRPLENIQDHWNAFESNWIHGKLLECIWAHCNQLQYIRIGIQRNPLKSIWNTLGFIRGPINHWNSLQCFEIQCNSIELIRMHWNLLQYIWIHCISLESIVIHRNPLACVEIHWNHWNSWECIGIQ